MSDGSDVAIHSSMAVLKSAAGLEPADWAVAWGALKELWSLGAVLPVEPAWFFGLFGDLDRSREACAMVRGVSANDTPAARSLGAAFRDGSS